MLFLFLSSMFFFYKIREQEGGTDSAGWGAGLALVGGGGDRRVNMVQIMYTYVSKCKNDTC
jgi:hypothetical protein